MNQNNSQNSDPFAPLSDRESDDLNWVVSQSDRGAVQIVDPDRGLVGAVAPNMISPNAGLSGVVRYGKHATVSVTASAA